MTLRVEVVSPEKIVYSGDADMVSCRTTEGEIAFLTGHAPFLGALADGEVRVNQPGGQVITAQVSGGFVEVKSDTVSILADSAEVSGDA